MILTPGHRNNERPKPGCRPIAAAAVVGLAIIVIVIWAALIQR